MGHEHLDYAKNHATELIWHTTGIELPDIILDEVKRILGGNAQARGDRKRSRIVSNIADAWRFLLDNTDWAPDLQYAQEYNRLIGDGMEFQPGQIRTIPITIAGTSHVPPIPTTESIRATFDEAVRLTDPVDRALLLFDRCCREQWFANGNKRTAAMLANHWLIHDEAGVFAIPVEQIESNFKGRLISYYETNNPTELNRWLADNAINNTR